MTLLSDYKNSTQSSDCSCCEQPPEKHCCVKYRKNKTVSYVGYDKWLPNVRILAPEIPDGILLDYIRRGAIEFAKRTHILERTISIGIQECVADYYPCLGADEDIWLVNFVKTQGYCYPVQPHSCEWETNNGTFWFHPPNSLELYPAPNECGELELSTIAVPKEYSSTVDAIIHDRYFEAIENFAVAKTHLIPGKPATSGQAHDHRMRAFTAKVTSAKIWLKKQYTNGVDFVDLGGNHGQRMC